MADHAVSVPGPGTSDQSSEHPVHRAGLFTLALGALGVVYGDIGTSPLYTLKECLHAAGGRAASVQDLFGILSLMVWSLVLVVTLKYLIFVMRANHHGEGGIFALLALVPERLRNGGTSTARVTGISLMAVAGAALLYGDGVITPAISVLSAMEGLTVANEAFRLAVIPLTCGILLGLFAIQKRGTGTVGVLFGPVMIVWFSTLALLGATHIVRRPDVLQALLPTYGLSFFLRHGLHGALILGSVVLTVTGGEALYADMGHFGVRPIRLAWFSLVFPALVLSYLGQGALVLEKPETAENPFFALVPEGAATVALVVLASAATIIASQALISGAFSLTRQAMALGYFPRMTVRHTAYHTEGQIYIPEMNTLLAIGCLLLVITFRESVRLAAAYGIAVTGTMAITSILFYVVARHRWHWPVWQSRLLLVLFLSVDIPFLAANPFKFMDGGYVPMLIGAFVIAAMLIWMRGRNFLIEQHLRCYPTYEDARPEMEKALCTRVPGTAVFLSSVPNNIPPILVHYVKCSHSLQEIVILMDVSTATTPSVEESRRYQITELDRNLFRVQVSLGFMEVSNIVPVMEQIAGKGELPIDLANVTYYVGHETTLNTNAGSMGRLAESLFGYLQRNAVKAEYEYGMPRERVIEVGFRVDL